MITASYKGNVTIMKLIIEKGAKIDQPFEFYEDTPLMNAAESGNIDPFKLLFEFGLISASDMLTDQSIIKSTNTSKMTSITTAI